MIKKAEILPKEVEVCQWTGHDPDEMMVFAGNAVHDIYENSYGFCCWIHTTRLAIGDYIIKKDNEVIDVCSEDNFKERYRFIE